MDNTLKIVNVRHTFKGTTISHLTHVYNMNIFENDDPIIDGERILYDFTPPDGTKNKPLPLDVIKISDDEYGGLIMEWGIPSNKDV